MSSETPAENYNNLNIKNSTLQGEIINVGGNLQVNYSRQRSCPKPPPKPNYFGGRESELQDLTGQLKTTDSPLALRGFGGIGKTTLARQITNDLMQDNTFCAVLWAEVTRDPNSLALLTAWAIYADPKYTLPDIPIRHTAWQIKALLESVIAEQCQPCDSARVLVVLDDVYDDPDHKGLNAAKLLMEACPTGSSILL